MLVIPATLAEVATPETMGQQVTLLLAPLQVPEGRAVVRAAALAETEGRVTPNWIYPEVAAVAAAVQV
jgi:hypothetical protein